MPEPRFVDGLSALVDRYDGFILDQWGVLHDGAAPYPDVFATLAELRRRDKQVVLLSNSGRRARLTFERLRRLGFESESFTAVVTSGEATWQLMRRRAHPPWSELGRRCHLLTLHGDLEVVAELGIELVEDPVDADFLFVSGLNPDQKVEALRPLAELGVARGLPMICSNPDIIGLSAGELTAAPGAFARLYEEAGGRVHYVGKPHWPIYEVCLEPLSALDRSRILAVGDSLEHDICGATNAGLDSAFVTQGIHAAEVPQEGDEDVRAGRLATLCTRFGATPTWAVPRLVW